MRGRFVRDEGVQLSKSFLIQRGEEKSTHWFSPFQSMNKVPEKSLAAFEAAGWVAIGRCVKDQFGKVWQSNWDGFEDLVKRLNANQSVVWTEADR